MADAKGCGRGEGVVAEAVVEVVVAGWIGAEIEAGDGMGAREPRASRIRCRARSLSWRKASRCGGGVALLASAPASALDASSVDDGSRVSAAGTEAPVTEAALASLTCSDGSVAVADGRGEHGCCDSRCMGSSAGAEAAG